MPKIAVVTSSRADYWLLKHLIAKLNKLKSLLLFISGEHLAGNGQYKIQSDGFLGSSVECYPKDDSYLDMAQAISQGIENFSRVFENNKPDILVLLGDRFEIFAAGIAAYTLKIPIAHIHGGELTFEALDDGFRHALSKMASIHFVSHEAYRKRLIRMGENPERVYTVGAIGLDNLQDSQYKNSASFFEKYTFLKNKSYFLLTLHPSTLSNESTENQVDSVIEALEYFSDFSFLITQANSDPGGAYINQRWIEWAGRKDNVHFIPTLGDDYLAAAFHSKLVMGNSSSNILEVPYLNRPALNLGHRQEGRIFPKGIYSTDFNACKIRHSIERIFREYSGSEQIYGIVGEISEKIYYILNTVKKDNLIYKRFYDAE